MPHNCAGTVFRARFANNYFGAMFSLLTFLFACRNSGLGYSLALLRAESFRLVLGRQ
jgi:hypothetical protein